MDINKINSTELQPEKLLDNLLLYQETKKLIIDVSIIIVDWNSGDYLKKTIESLYKWTNNINFEVIILDNNSNINNKSYKYLTNDILTAGYPNLKIIFNKKNLGFAKANNKGIDVSSGRHILLLNPDVILQNNIVKILCDYLDENPEVGMIGPKVLNLDGSFQSPCLRGEPNPKDVLFHLSGIAAQFSNNPKYNKFTLSYLDRDDTNSTGVAGLSGCCMMVRREVINNIGKMDEQFFMYQEETDWCWRAYKAGWKLVYNPEAVIFHEKGACNLSGQMRNHDTWNEKSRTLQTIFLPT